MVTIAATMEKMIRETGLTEKEVLHFYRLFFETFAKRVAQLEKGLSGEQYDQLGDNAHQLKGTAANLRLDELAALSADLVEAAKKKEEAECGRMIAKIADLGNGLKEQLAQLE